MINYHSFFFYLGTLEGNLLKSLVELILFTLITYMIVSEYTRESKRELKYLSFSFGLLAIQRLVITTVLFTIKFGDFNLTDFIHYLPIVENILETIALIMLANSFLYPVFKKKKNLRLLIKVKVAIVLFFGILLQLFWFRKTLDGIFEWESYFGHLFFIILDICLLVYPLIVLNKYSKVKVNYRKSIKIAFVLYLITPLIQLTNVIFFNGLNARLSVLQNPFPVLSVLMFTRIIYLKLVDKAYLKNKLEESEKLYEHEKHMSKLKDEFVSTVSHELRTPLTSIKLYNSLLRSGKFGSVSKKQHDALGIVKDETTRLSNLINDILNLSKLESGQIKLNKTKFNINSVIRNRIYFQKAEKKKITVKYKSPDDMFIFADKDKFIQIFVNLVDNAVKYSSDNGKIIVTCKDRRKESFFSVTDNGVGINPDEIPKLFDKFYRIEDYMTTSKQGAGLGLAIVKKLVELHGGTIFIESKKGKGSTFSVCIPKN